MKSLPETEWTLLIRTDFSYQAAWQALRAAITTPKEEEDFLANVDIVDDPAYRDLTSEQITSLTADEFLIVADKVALTALGMPLLVLLKSEDESGELRVIAEELWSIENNISIGNMDWSEFVDSADEDGVFRGF